MNLIFTKKNLISFSLMFVLIAALAFTIAVKASLAITQETSEINFTIKEEMRDDYTGVISAGLYKIADVSANGDYINAVNADLINGLSAYSSANTAEELKEAAELASSYLKGLSSSERESLKKATMTISEGAKNQKITVENGLYVLYFENPTVYGESMEYTFEDSLVSAPMNFYSASNGTADNWEYAFDINLKYGQKENLASIKIEKTVDTFDLSLGDQAFIYTVEAYRGEKLVYSNAVSIDMTASGTNSTVVEKIPANTRVVVTEKYTGASYIAKEPVVTIEKLSREDDQPVAAFTNTYNDKLIEGSIATVNTVSHTDEGFGLSVIGGAVNE